MTRAYQIVNPHPNAGPRSRHLYHRPSIARGELYYRAWCRSALVLDPWSGKALNELPDTLRCMNCFGRRLT
jgi:hypothetical protein